MSGKFGKVSYGAETNANRLIHATEAFLAISDDQLDSMPAAAVAKAVLQAAFPGIDWAAAWEEAYGLSAFL